MPDSDGSIAVLVLAAGQGTRMKSKRSKVLHEIAGRPMLDYPVTLAQALAPEHLVVVIGRDAEQVEATFEGRASFVLQAEQKGTAHAVQTAMPALAGFEGDVLILYGDTPLLRAESVARLIDLKADTGSPLAMLTSPEQLPGLILRDADGRVERIVEKTDATAEQLETLQEGNTGVYLVDMQFLTKALSQLDDQNEQGELYLTDIVEIARNEGLPVEAIQLGSADEALGVNNRAELARAARVQRARNVERLMTEGVTFIDPAASYVDTGVEIGRDTLVEPGVTITGNTRIGEECHIKPHCVIEDSRIGNECVLGPSAHVRPGCTLADGVRLGNYVEVKNSDLGPGVKADHSLLRRRCRRRGGLELRLWLDHRELRLDRQASHPGGRAGAHRLQREPGGAAPPGGRLLRGRGHHRDQDRVDRRHRRLDGSPTQPRRVGCPAPGAAREKEWNRRGRLGVAAKLGPALRARRPPTGGGDRKHVWNRRLHR